MKTRSKSIKIINQVEVKKEFCEPLSQNDDETILLEIISEKLLKEINFLLESIEAYKRKVPKSKNAYQVKKESLSNLIFSNNIDPKQNEKLVEKIVSL